MGRYTVIADISEKIVSLLCDGMVPDLIPDKNGIGLCGPDEKGDFLLAFICMILKKTTILNEAE